MNILDWVLICVGAFWVLRGLMRGAVSQLLGIAGILFGFYLASNHYQFVGALLKRQFPSISNAAVQPLSFILLFLLTWFVISAVSHWIVRLLHGAGLGFFDRLWGGMIGFGKALLFSIIAISILTLFSTDGKSSLVAQSKLTPFIMDASQFLFKMAPPKVQEELSKKQQEVKKLVSQRTSDMLDSFVGRGNDSKEKGGKNKDRPL